MAEQEPTLARAPQDERDEVARLQQALENAQHDVAQKESFGKYDVTVPNEGEQTYQTYLEQRPVEVIHDGKRPIEAESRRFASTEVYEAQNANTQDYYDQKGGLVNKGEYQPPNYEKMGVLQLAKEAAKARKLGDRLEEETITRAAEQYLKTDAMKDTSESTEEALARYNSEFDRYNNLIERFLGRPDANRQQSDEAHAEPNGEGSRSQRSTGESGDEPDAEPVEAEEPKESGTYYDGKKVSIAQSFTNFDPENRDRVVLRVVDDEGNVYDVGEDEVKYHKGSSVTKEGEPTGTPETPEVTPAVTPEATTGEAPTPEPTTPEASTPEPITPEILTVDTLPSAEGKELELYRTEGKELVPYGPEQEQASRKWWQKVGDYIRPRAGITAFWAAEFGAHTQGLRSWWVDRGVEDSMSPDEQEKKRQRNRKAALFGGGAIAAAAALVGGVLIAKGLSSGGSGNGANHLNDASSVGLGEHSTGFDNLHPGMQHAASQANEGVTNLPFDTGSGPGVESIANAPAAAQELFTVSPNEGGLQLFKNLGLDSTVWYDNARTLLEQFPENFYAKGVSEVGLRPGPLVQGAQDFINVLRQG
ncbi:MAG: hypothetical protein ACOH18_05320 [Candidatus Saccharimonadaceae bacterium]